MTTKKRIAKAIVEMRLSNRDYDEIAQRMLKLQQQQQQQQQEQNRNIIVTMSPTDEQASSLAALAVARGNTVFAINLESDQKCIKTTFRALGGNPYDMVDQGFKLFDYTKALGDKKGYPVAPLFANGTSNEDLAKRLQESNTKK